MNVALIWDHLSLVLSALILAVGVGVPLGLLAYLFPRFGKAILWVVDLIQTVPALALLAVLGPALGRALYQEERVGDHLPLLALGVLFSCWQSLGAYVLNGVDRQKASAAIALGADGVQLVLTCLTVGQWGMGGYAVSFVLASLVGAVLSWRAVAQATGLALPIFSWFTAPTLAACLAASCGDLMATVLLRAEAGVLPRARGGMGFGLLLYLAALQAMGVWGGKPERPP